LEIPPKVYFTNLRTQAGRNLLDKFDLLLKKAGIEKIDFKNKFIAIKMHFGEPGNLAFVRPNYAARTVKKTTCRRRSKMVLIICPPALMSLLQMD
jgi:uncharacterized Fe-S center protein